MLCDVLSIHHGKCHQIMSTSSKVCRRMAFISELKLNLTLPSSHICRNSSRYFVTDEWKSIGLPTRFPRWKIITEYALVIMTANDFPAYLPSYLFSFIWNQNLKNHENAWKSIMWFCAKPRRFLTFYKKSCKITINSQNHHYRLYSCALFRLSTLFGEKSRQSLYYYSREMHI